MCTTVEQVFEQIQARHEQMFEQFTQGVQRLGHAAAGRCLIE
jgi:hypothetical protein